MLRHALVVCGGWVAGVALQLQQAALADPAVYALVALVALPALWLAPRLRIGAQVLCLALALGALGWASTGLRAGHFARSALEPALEGRDVQVVGVVSDLPRRTPAGVRFRFALDSATLDGQPIELPPLLDVAWYSGPAPTAQGSWELQTQPADLRAGQR